MNIIELVDIISSGETSKVQFKRELDSYDAMAAELIAFSNAKGGKIFIENTNPGIDIICAIVSHLNEPQYHSGNFYKPGNTTDPSGSFCGLPINIKHPILSKYSFNGCNFFKDVFLFQLKIHLLC